jgi:hypothetical protein
MEQWRNSAKSMREVSHEPHDLVKKETSGQREVSSSRIHQVNFFLDKSWDRQGIAKRGPQ